MKKLTDAGISGNKNSRNASEPFTIHLKDEPYILTQESLREQVDPGLPGRQKWRFPDLKLASFEHNCLRLLNTYHGITFETDIRIEAGKLHVSCNCGSEVETLCIHAYRAVEHFSGCSYKNPLEQYCPKGLFEIATTHKKYFSVNTSSTGLDITPKYYLGKVYPFFIHRGDTDLPTILNLPGSPVSKKDEASENGLAYILAYSSEDECLPFLIPCAGYLSKDGTQIKSFRHFINETDKVSETFLSQDQKNLNVICFSMLKEVRKLSGNDLNTKESLLSPTLQSLFTLWKRAIPLLLQQEFVYTYYLYSIKELKRRPVRKRIRNINIRGETPHLRFDLRKKDSLYQLRLKAFVRGENIKEIEWFPTFFITEWQDVYMLSSLQDAALVKWMTDQDNCISVFKAHFIDFSRDILQLIEKYYPVETGDKHH